jgi:hypothetical protein
LAHIIDSLALTGQAYEVVYDSIGQKTGTVLLWNTATGDTLVRAFPIDRGEGVAYVLPETDGFTVEVRPEFDLALDLDRSFFRNSSGTTLQFGVTLPTAGLRLVAPIDAALCWGVTDTLADGSLALPLDTALATNGQRTVEAPFLGINLTDDERMTMLVVEAKANQRWDPGEKIIFLTPPRYRTADNNSHAEITTLVPPGAVVRPAPGDTSYVLTTRPLRDNERYTIRPSRSLILESKVPSGTPGVFALLQNYPNPFNPVTTLEYVVPMLQKVTVRVYTLLGQSLVTVADGVHAPGRYRVRFGSGELAAGTYFARLEAESGVMLTKKMLLVK